MPEYTFAYPSERFIVPATTEADARERAERLTGRNDVILVDGAETTEADSGPDRGNSHPPTDDTDEADAGEPDETESESARRTWSGKRLGIDADEKPRFEHGSGPHTLLSIIARLNRQNQLAEAKDCRQEFTAHGFSEQTVSSTMTALRDKYEAVFPVRGYPYEYATTARGKDLLEDMGSISPPADSDEESGADDE